MYDNEWVANNPREFATLCKPPEKCERCYRHFTDVRRPYSPINSNYPTSCSCFCCRSCWWSGVRILDYNELRCPLCREDITAWLSRDVLIVPCASLSRDLLIDAMAFLVKIGECSDLSILLPCQRYTREICELLTGGGAPHREVIFKKYNRQWVQNNTQIYFDMKRSCTECPVCFESFNEANVPLGPFTGGYATNCSHLCCKKCWVGISQRGLPCECPLCREDVSDWIMGFFYDIPGASRCKEIGFCFYVATLCSLFDEREQFELLQAAKELYRRLVQFGRQQAMKCDNQI